MFSTARSYSVDPPSPAPRAEPTSPQQTSEPTPYTKAARMEMLDELMAPTEDAECEEEITIQDGEEEQDAEPFKIARDPEFPPQRRR